MLARSSPTRHVDSTSTPNSEFDAAASWSDRGPRPGRVGLCILIGAIVMGMLFFMNWQDRHVAEPAAIGQPVVGLPPLEQPLPSLWIEELTWTEIAQAQAVGYDTVLLATGGTEQNGPHLPTGKHNAIVRFTAHEIAARRGGTLLAPVLAYVPEQPHVNFPGTISLPPEVFQNVVEAATQSFLTQGFKYVILLGDSGGNQEPLRAAAASLKLRCRSGQRVLFLDQYYEGHGQSEWLREQGFTVKALGTHAGVADTSEWLAVRPDGLRNLESLQRTDLGHDGSPELATAELGRTLLEMKINAALRQLTEALPR
ncbi:MAG: creatininase family protein [Pirellulaceae bacterium]|nr:creatininase family protein [Pirellulaceae bacterium]